LGLTAKDLTAALDPRVIIETRKGTGGAAPKAVESMIAHCEQSTAELDAAVTKRRQPLENAEQQLIELARHTAGQMENADD
jgi:argininosuccinate lyase